MGRYQISKKAEFDINHLYADGVLEYGLCQADRYYDGLIERFEFLADNPNIGINSDALSPNLQRFHYDRHMIFFCQYRHRNYDCSCVR